MTAISKAAIFACVGSLALSSIASAQSTSSGNGPYLKPGETRLWKGADGKVRRVDGCYSTCVRQGIENGHTRSAAESYCSGRPVNKNC